MGKKTIIEIPHDEPAEKAQATEQPLDVEDPFAQVDANPGDIAPDDLFEDPPYEPPAPGEGP